MARMKPEVKEILRAVKFLEKVMGIKGVLEMEMRRRGMTIPPKRSN